MIDVSIAAVPNQSLFVQLDERAYSLTFRTTGQSVAVTIVRDDVTLVEGSRVVTGTPLLPYRHQEAGNFVLSTQDQALPDYAQFGITQFLTYLSADELATARA
jgi:hypothetical protein